VSGRKVTVTMVATGVSASFGSVPCRPIAQYRSQDARDRGISENAMADVQTAGGSVARWRDKLISLDPKRLPRTVLRLAISRAQGIEDLTAARANPGFGVLRDQVRASGTDSVSHFGNGYSGEGGLYLQQNPDEFAALVLRLRQHGPIRNYVEIGSASGGACRFIYENVGFERAFCLDDGQHPRAPEQSRNFAHVKNLKRFVGDSHSTDARRFLAENLYEPADVAFIDGDHSYEGVWADIRLAMAFSRPGTLFVFHDTVACDGVERAWLGVLKGGLVKGVAEYVGSERPLGIGIGVVR
jgi:hypothetical protein